MDKLNDIITYSKDLTLLYVEDDIDTREITTTLLENIFDNIVVAVDGKDGLEKFQSNNIDLIITDINMPSVDGISMCKSIKHINSSIPIIMLTAFDNTELLKKAIDLGIEGFLNKPLTDMDILIDKLKVIIKRIDYEKVKIYKARNKLIIDMIKHFAHHWRQPLSLISTIASGISYKYENNLEFNNEDFKNLVKIIEQTEELSDMFNKIENVNFDTIKLSDIENIIQLSNPIYKRP